MRGSSGTAPSHRALERWARHGPPRPGKGHTGPHRRQRGALRLRLPACSFSALISFIILLVLSYLSVTRGGVSPHFRGTQGEQLVGIIALAAVVEVVLYPDQPRFLQLLDGSSHGAVGDPAGFGDGPPTGVTPVLPVVTPQQVAVHIKRDGRQLMVKDFVVHHKEVSASISHCPHPSPNIFRPECNEFLALCK